MPRTSKRYHTETINGARCLILDISKNQGKALGLSGKVLDCKIFKSRTAMFFNHTTGLNIWHRATIKRITGWMPPKQRHKNRPPRLTFTDCVN